MPCLSLLCWESLGRFVVINLGPFEAYNILCQEKSKQKDSPYTRRGLWGDGSEVLKLFLCEQQA